MKEGNVKSSRRSFLNRAACGLAVVWLRPYAQAEPSNSRVVVKVSGIRSKTGSVVIRIWTSKDGFPKNRAKAFRQASASILNDKAVATFSEVPHGAYAVALFMMRAVTGGWTRDFQAYP